MSAPSPVNMTFDDIRLDSPLCDLFFCSTNLFIPNKSSLNAGRRLLEIALSDKEKHLFHCWALTVRAANSDPGFLRLVFPQRDLSQYERGLVERMDEAQRKKCARMVSLLSPLSAFPTK